MPYALTIGVPYETFWHLVPNELRAFYKSYKQRQKIKDEEMWMMGQYVMSAVSFAIDHNLRGKKAQSKYIEKPIMSDNSISASKDENNMSQEEKNRQIEQLFLKLEIMGKNHKLTKEKEEKEKGGSQ